MYCKREKVGSVMRVRDGLEGKGKRGRETKKGNKRRMRCTREENTKEKVRDKIGK